MPQNFVEVEIQAGEGTMEQLIGLLSQLGFEGFWEDGGVLRCFISASRWQPEMLEEVRRMAVMLIPGSSAPAPSVSARAVEDRNWNAEWEQTIKPIRVTDRIVITPTWHHYQPVPGDLVLIIDPKMSFGTGYHETTRLCLRLLERHISEGMNVLDIGTGTGVLAIAAAILGARKAVAVDVDEWSFSNAIENVRLNGVADKVDVLEGDLAAAPTGPYDLILANIQRNVLEPMVPDMKKRLPGGGVVLLSGLLEQDERPMIDALHGAGFSMIEQLREQEWMALAARVL